jgi:hypothetical protein
MSYTSNSSPLTIVGDGDPIAKLYIALNFIIFIPSTYAMCLLHVQQFFFCKAAAQSRHISYGYGYLQSVNYCIDSRPLLPFILTKTYQYYRKNNTCLSMYFLYIYFSLYYGSKRDHIHCSHRYLRRARSSVARCLGACSP